MKIFCDHTVTSKPFDAVLTYLTGSQWRKLQATRTSVRVIEGFKANTYKEMSVLPGEIVEVTEVSNDMAHGPNGWFPMKNAVPIPGITLLGHVITLEIHQKLDLGHFITFKLMLSRYK